MGANIFRKNVTNICHITTWVFPQNYLSNSWGSQSFFVFPDLPKSDPGISSLHHMADEASLEGSNGNEKSSVDTLVELGTSGTFCESKLVSADWRWKKCVKILLFIQIVYIYIYKMGHIIFASLYIYIL